MFLCEVKRLILCLHNFADKAGDDASYKATDKSDWDGDAQFFYLGLAKIKCGYIEDRFRATHNNAGAAGNVTVRAVGRKKVAKHRNRPRAGKRAQGKKVDKFLRYPKNCEGGRQDTREQIR